MRITIPIAAVGGRSQTRIPMPSASLDECLGPNGKIDRASAAMANYGLTRRQSSTGWW